MSFNFGSFANANAVNTSAKVLKPYNSYKVKFEGAEIKTVAKKDDPSTTYDTIQLHFEGEDGVFNPSIFFPSKPEDNERPTFQNANGHDYQRPSRMEDTMYLLLQSLTVLDPEGAEKFKANVGKAKSFMDVAKMYTQLINVKKGEELYIKLTGRNNNGTTYAQFPNCVGLNKEGELFPVNVMSKKDDFRWSSYELQQKAAYENAKPTNMITSDPLGIDSHGSEDEIDFDNLLR